MRLLDIYKFLVVVLFCSPPQIYNKRTNLHNFQKLDEGFSSKLGLVVCGVEQLTIIIKNQDNLKWQKYYEILYFTYAMHASLKKHNACIFHL